MKNRLIFSVATVVAVIASGGVNAASDADKVGIMPIPVKITLDATIHQCVEPRIPESDCLRICFPRWGENACLELVEPWKSPVAFE